MVKNRFDAENTEFSLSSDEQHASLAWQIYSWQSWNWKRLGCALTHRAFAEAKITIICSHETIVVGLFQPEPLLHQTEVSGNYLPASSLELGSWRENVVW